MSALRCNLRVLSAALSKTVAFQRLNNWLTVTDYDVATPVQNLKNEVSLDRRPIKSPLPFLSWVWFSFTPKTSPLKSYNTIAEGKFPWFYSTKHKGEGRVSHQVHPVYNINKRWYKNLHRFRVRSADCLHCRSNETSLFIMSCIGWVSTQLHGLTTEATTRACREIPG